MIDHTPSSETNLSIQTIEHELVKLLKHPDPKVQQHAVNIPNVVQDAVIDIYYTEFSKE